MKGPVNTTRQRLDYQVVFECRFLHDYFDDGRCRGIVVGPTPGTAARLPGMGLLFHRLADGFVLAADTGRDRSNPIHHRPEILEFSFRATDPQFLRYTELPYLAGQHLVFDNGPAADGALHPGTHVDASSLAPADTDGITGLLRVKHSPEAPFLPGPDGSATAPVTPRYLRFAARNAILRYVFHGKIPEGSRYEDYFIENFAMNGIIHTFTLPLSLTLRNGANAFRMDSREPVAMRQTWKAQGVLRRRKSAGMPFEYRRTLPLPRPDSLYFDQVSGRFVSETIVKL
jgi:hypothetical protein